jgi:hypothetical protein
MLSRPDLPAPADTRVRGGYQAELLPVQSAGSSDGTRARMSVARLLLLPKCNETIEGKTHRWLADPKPLRLVFYGREFSRLSVSRGDVALRLFQLVEPSQVGVVVGWLGWVMWSRQGYLSAPVFFSGSGPPTNAPRPVPKGPFRVGLGAKTGASCAWARQHGGSCPSKDPPRLLCACVGQTPSYSVTADEGFVEHARHRYPVRVGFRFVPPDFSGTKSTSGERFSCKCLPIHSASVAQLDRASDYGSEGFRFDS